MVAAASGGGGLGLASFVPRSHDGVARGRLAIAGVSLLLLRGAAAQALGDGGAQKSAVLFFESGTVDSGLAVPLEPTFSINSESTVEDSSGDYFVSNALHNLSVEQVSWAREGSHVLKVYADGRNFGTSLDYAWRSELGAVQEEYKFFPDDEHYFTASFFPPSSSWDQEQLYSTIISQWKMSGGIPHAALRLSNTGDYKLTFAGADFWDEETDEGKFIGHARLDAWNDVKVYFKMSFDAVVGVVKVWLNGELVFDYAGTNILRNGFGYAKFGLYTEIRDQRTLYFDAVKLSNFIDVPMAEWSADQAHLPTVSLSAPGNGHHQTPSGSLVTLAATAADPGGEKYGSDGRVVSVEFFAGDCSLGTATEPPYRITLTMPDGPHALSAMVTDADSNEATSDTVVIYFGPKPPAVAITSPANLDNFASAEAVAVSVTASEEDGTVASVEVFVDDVSVGVDTTSAAGVYSATWVASSVGVHVIKAVATDSDGQITESSSVRVTVGATISSTATNPTDDASLLEGDADSTADWGDVEVNAAVPFDDVFFR